MPLTNKMFSFEGGLRKGSLHGILIQEGADVSFLESPDMNVGDLRDDGSPNLHWNNDTKVLDLIGTDPDRFWRFDGSASSGMATASMGSASSPVSYANGFYHQLYLLTASGTPSNEYSNLHMDTHVYAGHDGVTYGLNNVLTIDAAGSWSATGEGAFNLVGERTLLSIGKSFDYASATDFEVFIVGNSTGAAVSAIQAGVNVGAGSSLSTRNGMIMGGDGTGTTRAEDPNQDNAIYLLGPGTDQQRWTVGIQFGDDVAIKPGISSVGSMLRSFGETVHRGINFETTLFADRAIGFTSISTSNPASIACSVQHGLVTYQELNISGGTGDWTAVNGNWFITRTGASTFTIPVNSTAFTGTPTLVLTLKGRPIIATGTALLGGLELAYPFNTHSDNSAASLLWLTQASGGPMITVTASSSNSWSIGTKYGATSFAIGAGVNPASAFTAPEFTIAVTTGDVGIKGKVTGGIGAGAGTMTNIGVASAQISAAGVGNTADTNDDTLFTYSLPLNSLSANGKSLRVVAAGHFASNGNNKQVKIKFAGAAVVDSGVVTSNNLDWMAEAEISRIDSTHVSCRGTFTVSGSAPVVTTLANQSVSDLSTNASAILTTGASPTTGAAGDVLGYIQKVWFEN